MKLTDQEIGFLKHFFSTQPVKKAYVFGSYSRGEADITSDLDILVELDYSVHIGIGFIKMKTELEEKLKKTVDLVSKRGVSRHILPFLEKDKILIYEK